MLEVRLVSAAHLRLALSLAAAITHASCGYIGFEATETHRSPDAGTSGGDPQHDAGGADGTKDAAITDGRGDVLGGDGDAGPTSNEAQLDSGPLAVCGNGVLEAGEQCDDSGASATCDADCTFASCGDGRLNTLAGEACDDGEHLATCTTACREPSCREGCTCEWYRGTRYMFCAEQLAREPARDACEEQGMKLVRIESGAEQTFLRQRTLQAGMSKFHLAATDQASEGTWVWDDGTPFWQGMAEGEPINGAFSAWAPGEPNSFTIDENCSEVQSMQGWNDCVCDLAKPFVCKDQRAPRAGCGNGVVEAGEACDDCSPSAACDADCSPASCGDGSVNVAAGEVCDDGNTGQYCQIDCSAFLCPDGCQCFQAGGADLALCTAAKTFAEAGVACGAAGMTLAGVESAAIDQALRSAATSANVSEYWIGLFDLDQANHWLRSDLSPAWSGTSSGSGTGYTHFTNGAPSGSANKDCATVLASGSWQDRSCTTPQAFACERL